jgi:osmotically-inducible protein OsmY
VGNKSIEHLQEVSGGAQGRLGTGLEALRGSISERTPDSRVAARLRWDKELAGSAIRARMLQPGVVELQGTLGAESQRARALQVAQTTTGVEQVVDLLQVAGS